VAVAERRDRRPRVLALAALRGGADRGVEAPEGPAQGLSAAEHEHLLPVQRGTVRRRRRHDAPESDMSGDRVRHLGGLRGRHRCEPYRQARGYDETDPPPDFHVTLPASDWPLGATRCEPKPPGG